MSETGPSKEAIEKDHEKEWKYNTYLVGPNDERAEICRAIERAVFLDSFGNTSEEMDQEYGPYEQNSYFILATDTTSGHPVGMVRIILNSPAGLKSLNDLEKTPWCIDKETALTANGITDIELTVDHATTAVLPEYRRSKDESSLVHLALQASFYSAVINQLQKKYFVAIFDDKPLAALNAIGMGIKTLEPASSKPYLGSKGSTPIYGELEAMLKQIKETNPWLHDLIDNNRWFKT